eukprot:CAMPEP_0118686666 /NCGR_PEP_ID=MMETSP0800-20121206/7943_1 /TAXON_ID=210618 ORGANISM="Striatella unipunctata, Strain CCMP2910" /NCGR_SAMPLE_ID=MMETSP0800 /ASSEMBLY_ACC=CAM_ASM_000638 /LENGTH=180 /DNA_ID=CAMNT_0006583743 /DNA_START=307 /DNA_END=849 /DNA_ORIENTATION=-
MKKSNNNNSNNNHNNYNKFMIDSSNYTLVVAHANTLRALVMHLDGISPDQIEKINIPTAIPFYYDVNVATGKLEKQNNTNDSGVFGGTYISDSRKQRSFLERRRAADDPWLWALDDDQVSYQMLQQEEQEQRQDTTMNAAATSTSTSTSETKSSTTTTTMDDAETYLEELDNPNYYYNYY